jgi:hypothetical protein
MLHENKLQMIVTNYASLFSRFPLCLPPSSLFPSVPIQIIFFLFTHFPYPLSLCPLTSLFSHLSPFLLSFPLYSPPYSLSHLFPSLLSVSLPTIFSPVPLQIIFFYLHTSLLSFLPVPSLVSFPCPSLIFLICHNRFSPISRCPLPYPFFLSVPCPSSPLSLFLLSSPAVPLLISFPSVSFSSLLPLCPFLFLLPLSLFLLFSLGLFFFSSPFVPLLKGTVA